MPDQGWYARARARMTGTPAPASYQPPPSYPGLNAPMRNAPPANFQVVPQPVQPVPQERVTVENLFQAAGHWKGGPAARADAGPCPECGSNHFFAISIGKRGPPPAPRCWNCGYNGGLFEQGLQSSWS